MALSREELRQLAITGAKSKLQQLDAERRSLMREFPELGPKRPVRARPAVKPNKRRMTAAQRKAVSKRMKALWVERRKAKGKAA